MRFSAVAIMMVVSSVLLAQSGVARDSAAGVKYEHRTVVTRSSVVRLSDQAWIRLLDVLRIWEGPTYGIMTPVRFGYRANARIILERLIARYGSLRMALMHYGPGPEDCRRHPEQLCGLAYADNILRMARL
jgi:hypothetical protein